MFCRVYFFQLDDWVLCRIYNKKGGAIEKHAARAADRKPSLASIFRQPATPDTPEQKPDIMPQTSAPLPQQQQQYTDLMCFDTSESLPRLHADSSCSEHVLSPDFTCEREVQSQPKWAELERALGLGTNNIDAAAGAGGYSMDDGLFSPLLRGNSFQDFMMYLQKPF